MFRHKLLPTVLIAAILLGAGALLGVRFTQGQEPDRSEESTAALGSGFTYEGELSRDGAPVDDTCDFTFTLHDADSGGNQIGATETEPDVEVNNGHFIVLLNDAGQFGPDAFNGEARWLEIAVRCSGDLGFTNLGRQQLTASPYALNAASVPWEGITGIPDGVDQGTPYENVIVVAKSGGDFTHIQAALDSIAGASAGNPYLVWVAPGVYQEQVTMKAHVDIEGAGQDRTIIRWTGGGQSPVDGTGSATVTTAANSELRSLTVESDGSGQVNATAIHVTNSAAPTRITHVTASASGAGSGNTGLYNAAQSTRISDATITAFSNNLSVDRGVYNSGDSLTLVDSTITVGGDSIENTGIHNEGNAALIRGLTITVTGDASEGTTGIHNEISSGTHIDTTVISVSNDAGFGATTGVSDNQSPTALVNVTIVASGPDSTALYNAAAITGSTTVHNSRLEGETYSVVGESLASVHVAASQLDGPVNITDELSRATCVHSYDADFNELDTNCQPPP